ncbi:uncharacterized protein LOC142173015 [Nicotiana tabacum]|uniref:Uncharacterized protein LOC142173015 n=1 Tax=Nicotiana tabacum TaxID=4097 RepID=A0AC58T8Y1_TOBAC
MIYSCLPGVTLVLSKLYIRQFSVAFGLQANLTKSFIYFGGVEKTEQMRILQIISYSLGELPFKYLGIPLDTKYLTILRWQPLVERIVARVSSWTARKLSYARRVELVQTVLFGIQSYWAQLFIIPAKVMKLAAITKTYWDLAHKKDKASIRWIHAYYIKGKNILDIAIPQHASWMVRKILDARKNAQQIPSLNQQKNFIKQIYLGLMGNHNKVKWRRLLFHNDARPREIFSMWLQCHERLLIVDRLAKWESK